MADPSRKNLNSSMSGLQISTGSHTAPKPKSVEPVDSWEDEADHASDMDAEDVHSPPARPFVPSDYPEPPPPTPASPSFAYSPTSRGAPYQAFSSSMMDGAFDDNSNRAAGAAHDVRQEKTTAVASRLIAAGIGQKAPRRTKEEREYDQAMKVQEKKKRDRARETEEEKRREKEQAMKNIWGA